VINLNNLIEKILKELTSYTNVSYDDVKFVTIKEFHKTPYEKTKLNYIHFIDAIKPMEINTMINLEILYGNI
jgi:hypothetical protein